MLFLNAFCIFMQSDLDDKEGHEYLDGILTTYDSLEYEGEMSEALPRFIFISILALEQPHIALYAALHTFLHDLKNVGSMPSGVTRL